MTSVVLVDDQDLVRTGLRRILRPAAGFEIVAECDDGAGVDDAVRTWQPDVVVINQGTNDRNATSDQFRPGYRRYLQVIRKAYPNAKILALRPFNGAHADDIKAEISARVAAGDANVAFVDTTGWVDAATDYTDKVHPNAGAGPKIAEKLAAVIEKRPDGK